MGPAEVNADKEHQAPQLVRSLEVSLGEATVFGPKLDGVAEGHRGAVFNRGLTFGKKEDILGVGVAHTDDGERVESFA